MKNMKYIVMGLLLVGGLIHLLPATLTPLAEMGYGIVTIQRIVGFASVIIAAWMLVAPGTNE